MRFSAVSAVTVVLFACLSGGTAAAAETQTASFDPEPWQPFRATNFTAPAGRYCDFDLQVTAVEDEEEVRVDARYPDGAIRLNEYRGKLVSRFTNLATGESVLRDLSGRGFEERYPDGRTLKSFTVIGPFSFGFRDGDGFPKGYYRLSGLHSISLTQTGVRSMAVDAGPEENMCETLG
ncbi:MAG TPA: hypothetical protein VH969_18760 [Actinophytocola sp.]|jgi:hypothetical protein|uniref:hypothetical protein n=1 Tax=Actinophytocola sp. TaxID=1872138 RepID=UPI002F9303A1